MNDYLNPRDFGAVGDGLTDDTSSLQKAFDEADKTGLSVYISNGVYSVGELFVHPEITIKSDHTWAFRNDANGRAVLKQRFPEQKCLLNLTSANGATLYGLSLSGLGGNTKTVGMLIERDKFGDKEDAFRIDSCRVSNFGSHAASFERLWCFSIRHCMFAFSGGDGISLYGWDGFIEDNWLTGNRGSGWCGERNVTASITMTGNRIEWNGDAGIALSDSSHYNITGNYIDRSGAEAIRIKGSHTITCTGNILYRSEKYVGDNDCAHCSIIESAGVTFTGNALHVGQDDGGRGELTPPVGIRVKSLKNCVVTSNTINEGAMKLLVDDLGGHENLVLRDNPGSVCCPY